MLMSKIIRTARARTSPYHQYCVSTAGQQAENLFALLLFSIGSIHTYPGASGKLGTVHSQQNAYIERYNRTVRTEWLGRYHFDSIEDVQDHATRWLWTYNNERPNMGIGGITPIQK